MCNICYRATRTASWGLDCAVTDCSAPVQIRSRRLCAGHYRRLLRYGDPTAGPGKGSPGVPRKKHNRPGEYVANGYRRIRRPDGAWVLEHRHVMEQRLGRRLRPNENVHHNNSLDNLELWVRRQPQGVRALDLVAWALEILDRYAVTEVLDPDRWDPPPEDCGGGVVSGDGGPGE